MWRDYYYDHHHNNMSNAKRIPVWRKGKKLGRLSRCVRCAGTGMLCDECGEPEGACECGRRLGEEPAKSECGDCRGTVGGLGHDVFTVRVQVGAEGGGPAEVVPDV